MAIPGESRIEEKELEKISKYLGAIPRDLRKHLRTIGLESISPSQLQKTVQLGTAHILRKYL